MVKKLTLVALVLAGLFTLAACTQLDVVGTESVTSFEKVAAAAGDLVAVDDVYGGYALNAPDGAARFILSRDFSKTSGLDVAVELDAQPFVNAGLDTAKLPESIKVQDNKLVIGTDLGSKGPAASAKPVDAYKQVVDQSRDSVKYHAALDHYGVELTGDNMFEWAKDIAANDKDIVFVLNPQPFIDAGVDVNAVEGWVFAKVPTMDKDNKPIEVDKLLKPFNLN